MTEGWKPHQTKTFVFTLKCEIAEVSPPKKSKIAPKAKCFHKKQKNVYIFAGCIKIFLQNVLFRISTVRNRRTDYNKKEAAQKGGFFFYICIYPRMERIKVEISVSSFPAFLVETRAEKPSQ